MPSISATTPTPCPCCGGCVVTTVSCGLRGGVATLCGFSEFLTTPSSPPKKYRNIKPEGKPYICYYGNSSCTGTLDTVDSYDLDGADELIYNASTCEVNTGHYTHYVNSDHPSTCGYSTSGTATVEVEGVFSIGAASETTANSVITRTLTTCEVVFDNGATCNAAGFDYYHIYGSQKQTLSIEDTESDALSRLLAGPGGTWSSYSGGPCVAGYEIRTSGFSFHYNEARWRAQATGLTPGTNYTTYIQYWRRPYGTGSYTLFQTVIVYGTADGTGLLSIDGDVPNDKGYETYAAAGSCP